jgi:hypothetical protein
MKLSAVGVEEGHDVDGRDLCVKGVGVFEVVVPNFNNDVARNMNTPCLAAL